MTTADHDRWWKQQFVRLLSAEERGVDPRSLEQRWLLLNARTWGTKRWQVTFDVPEPISHLLDDADVRAKDQRYAQYQWAAAREWLNA